MLQLSKPVERRELAFVACISQKPPSRDHADVQS